METGLRHPRRLGLLALIVSTVIILDQFTKWLVTGAMRLHESISIVPDLFSLTYIRNSGAAFGILAGSHAGFRLVFFGLTSVLALALLGTIYVRLSPADWIGQVSVASIFGGAVGNLIDRIRSGEVIDFLDFSLLGHHWPAFNVADAAITVGVCFLIGHFFMHKETPV
jgi:signal peptidase II